MAREIIENIDDLIAKNSSVNNDTGFLSDALRGVSGVASSFASGLAGSVPSLLGLGARGLAYVTDKLGDINKSRTPLDKLLGREAIDMSSDYGDNISSGLRTLAGYTEKASPRAIKGYIDEATGGYTSPTGELSNVAQTIASEIGEVAAPTGLLGGAKKGLKLAARSIAPIATANTVESLLKNIGAPKYVVDNAKLASMVLYPAVIGGAKTLFGTNNSIIKRTATKLYNDIKNEVPSKMSSNVSPIKDAIRKAERVGRKGGALIDRDRNWLINKVSNAVREKIGDRDVWNTRDLIELKKSINSQLAAMPKNASPEVAKAAVGIKNAIFDSLSSSGKNVASKLKEADKLYSLNFRGLKKAADIVKAIKAPSGKTVLLGAYLAPFLSGALKFAKKGAPVAGVGLSADQVARAFGASPTFRKELASVASKIGRMSVPAARKAVNRLIEKNLEPEVTLESMGITESIEP